MKRLMTGILSICMLLTLVACGGTTGGTTTSTTADSTQASNENETTTTTAEAEASTGSEAASTDTEGSGSNTLVVYFSATGTTKGIAESIAAGLSADTYEIVAADPYTTADLNYSNDNSRSTREMNDASARPAISGSVSNWDQYDTIYVGYPIWWGEAPRIVDTFVEAYDFTGKTVIPFCTSSSSGMGSSGRTLESLAGAGTWNSGRRFRGNESQDTVMEWVNSL